MKPFLYLALLVSLFSSPVSAEESPVLTKKYDPNLPTSAENYDPNIYDLYDVSTEAKLVRNCKVFLKHLNYQKGVYLESKYPDFEDMQGFSCRYFIEGVAYSHSAHYQLGYISKKTFCLHDGISIKRIIEDMVKRLEGDPNVNSASSVMFVLGKLFPCPE
jgi:hypothetical protein